MYFGLLTILLASCFSPQQVKMARRDYFPVSPSNKARTSAPSELLRPRLPYFPSSSKQRTYYPVKSEEPKMPLRSGNHPRTSNFAHRTFAKRRRTHPTHLPNLADLDFQDNSDGTRVGFKPILDQASTSQDSIDRTQPDLNPVSNQDQEEESCPRLLPSMESSFESSLESNCSLPSQAPSLPPPTVPPDPISPGYAFFRHASEVMLDPSLPQGTPYASNPSWESPRVRHNSSQTVVEGEVVEEVENDPHLESATLIKGTRRRRIGQRRRQGRIISIFSLVRWIFPNTQILTDKNLGVEQSS